MSRPFTWARATALICGLLLVAGPIAPPAAARPAARLAAQCVNADLPPGPGNLASIRVATLCLVNAERRARGLAALRSNPSLRTAAQRYAQQIVRRRFFAHVSPDGSTLLDRVRRTAYLSTARRWSLGENLAWATEPHLTPPVEVVRSWMRSPRHRANVLRRSFREVGLGVALGTHLEPDGATFVANFGRR